MKQIHGHDVLNMMLETGRSYSRERLIADIIAKFGEDAQFHTCSAENMTAEGLVDFLQAKGKFVPQKDGGMSTSPELICKHG